MDFKMEDQNFGKRLRLLRKRVGLTQTDLGNALGVSKRVIYYYEKKGKYPPGKFLPKIAQELKVSLEELMGIEAIKENDTDGRTIDGKLLQKIHKIQELPLSKKKAIGYVLDAFLAEAVKK